METNVKTRRRVYLWILFAVLVFFPLFWMLQPSVASPYSTAMQVTDGTLAIDPIHPLAPNRIERFGTDALGRPITTLIAKSIPPAAAIAALAALLRALLGALFARFRLRLNIPSWIFVPVEIILYGFLLSLPLFATRTPADHYLLLTVLLGLYFLPAQKADLSLRRIGLTVMEQFVRILLLFIVLGLLGRTVGANPYAAIPTAYGPVVFTYPFLTNLIASVWQSGLHAWWTWLIPILAVLAVVLAVLLIKTPMQHNYERRGVYFTNLAQDFLTFINPVTAAKELIRFREHVAKNSLRITLLLLLLVFFTWGATDPQNEGYTPTYNQFAQVQQEVAPLQTADARLDYAETLFRNSRINPVGNNFRITDNGVTLVTGIRSGVSRTQPLLLIFDVNADDTTFAMQIALVEAALENAQNIWLQQSLLFAFTDSPEADFRTLLDLSGNGFFAVISMLKGEPVQIDETLVFPGNSWAGAIAEDFRYGFERHKIPHELAWLQQQNRLALTLSEQGWMGVQIRGGDPADPQSTLQALTDAVMRYGTRERSYR